MSVLAIDPGTTKGCACAQFEYLQLVHFRVTNVYESVPTLRSDYVVVEVPDVLHNSTPSDLIRCAVAGVRLAERYCADSPETHVTEYRPAEWKGNVPKPIHHLRLWAVLTASERARLGGPTTFAAIEAACARGAKDKWKKPGDRYYRRREMATVDGQKVDDNILDAVALGCTHLGRMKKP